MKDDFEYKIYDKFTELFVGQKGINDSLKMFEGTVGNIATSVSTFHLRLDDMSKTIAQTNETIIKQDALISASVKVLRAAFLFLGACCFFISKGFFHEISELFFKFFR